MKKIIFLLLFLLNAFLCKATLITAVANGNWTSPSTWSCGCVPNGTQDITIPATFNVLVNSVIGSLINATIITITVNGTLTLNSSSLFLDSNDIFNVNSGGSVVSAGLGANVWSGAVDALPMAFSSTKPGPFTITNGILPITIVYFKGSEINQTVLLTWASASEKEFDHYTIERSKDGQEFEPIGIIQGAGTSVTQKNYEYVDKEPISGQSYYRLKAVDLDGDINIFNVVGIIFHDPSQKVVSVFPNPIKDHQLKFQLNFQPTSTDYFLFVRGDGSIASSSFLQITSNEFILDPNINSGIYLLKIFTSQGEYVSRVVVE